MKTRILMTTLAFLCSSAAFAGRRDSCSFRITEVFLNGGSSSGRDRAATLNDFKTMAPGTMMLNSDFRGFVKGGMYRSGSNPLAVLGIGVQRAENGPVIRLGLSYGTGSGMFASFYKNKRERIDTLFSPRTGRTVYTDTVYGESYRFSGFSNLLMLDASAIWRSSHFRRWSLFGGFGFSAGATLNAYTELRHEHYGYLRGGLDYSSGSYESENRGYETETYQNRMQTSASLNLPFGIDFRMGNRNSFWKQIHLFQETRFRILYYRIPELESEMSTQFYFGFGLRYSIPEYKHPETAQK